jgi:hypothetical protein
MKYSPIKYTNGNDLKALKIMLAQRKSIRHRLPIEHLDFEIDSTGERYVVTFVDEHNNAVGPLPFTTKGFGYLLQRFNMPRGYFMHRSAANLTLEHFQDHQKKIGRNAVTLVEEDNNIVTALTDRHAFTPHEFFVDDIAAIPNVVVAGWSYSPETLRILVKGDNTHQTKGDLKNGDAIYLTMLFQGYATLPPQLGHFRKVHLGAVTHLTAQFEATWNDLTTNYLKVALRLEAMLDEKVNDMEVRAIVEQIAELLGLSSQIREDIIELADNSIYSIWDACLQIANNSPAHAVKLRKAAGNWIIDETSSNPLWVTM